MGLAFAHPYAALAALAGLVPLAVAVLQLRTERRVRRGLDLPEPRPVPGLVRPVALACLFVLLGLAAARPALRLQHERTVRTDVQVNVVLDSSRSMLAASAPGRPERWQRAAAFAARLQRDLPGVPIGLSSMTNRVLPYLFPTSDPRAYQLVLQEAYGIQKPPPALTIDRWLTTFDSLNEGTVRRLFSPNVHRRVLVVLSDAETRQFEARTVLRQLEQAGTTPVVVRFWSAGERIFQPGAASYRATQPGVLNTLRAAGWPAYSESQLGAAVRRIRAAVGSGPSVRAGYAQEEVQLAWWLALAAFLPLLLLVGQGGWLRLRPGRVPRPGRGFAVSRVATRPDSHAH